MKPSLRETVTTWPFLLALATLLANDFWFKRAWPGLVTGKLSDFAGIAVVSLLLFAAFPGRRRLASVGIVVGFAWWKSPLSQPAIDGLNAWLPVAIGRTVDYTDLVAFIIMPASAIVSARAGDFAVPGARLRRWLAAPAIALTAFALMATSSPSIMESYQIRRANNAPELDRDAVERTIAQVAALNGLARTPLGGPFEFAGNSVYLTYEFVGARGVSFDVFVDPYVYKPFFGPSDKERADRLRNDLKTRLAADFGNLEYVESLGPRHWPRPASAPASGP